MYSKLGLSHADQAPVVGTIFSGNYDFTTVNKRQQQQQNCSRYLLIKVYRKSVAQLPVVKQAK